MTPYFDPPSLRQIVMSVLTALVALLQPKLLRSNPLQIRASRSNVILFPATYRERRAILASRSMPGAKCTICEAPSREAAENAIAPGISVRKVAEQFSLSYPSLDRHQRKCLKRAVARVAEIQQVRAGQSLLDRLEALQDATLELVSEARNGRVIEMPHATDPKKTVRAVIPPDPTEARLAIAQARRNLEVIGRITGELEPPKDDQSGGPKLITFADFEALYVRVRGGQLAA